MFFNNYKNTAVTYQLVPSVFACCIKYVVEWSASSARDCFPVSPHLCHIYQAVVQ